MVLFASRTAPAPEDWPIQFELLIGDNVTTTSHPRIRQAHEKMLPFVQVESLLDKLRRACDESESERARALLLDAVEEFAPQCANQDLLIGARVL